MSLVNRGLTIVDFDETYYEQTKLLNYSHERLDFRDLMHVNLFCGEDSFHILVERLSDRKQKGITFIGSGNYHYLTYLLINEITKPFTLVLFDNHPDLGIGKESQHMLSCGSWVSCALSNNSLLQRVVIIGPTAALSKQSTYSRTVIYPFSENYTISPKLILSNIHTENIYISIDKDVLSTNEVQTNWDQGMMSIPTLQKILDAILLSKKVVGVDICGEVRLSPLQLLQPTYQTIIHKNEKANFQILQTVLKASNQHTKGA